MVALRRRGLEHRREVERGGHGGESVQLDPGRLPGHREVPHLLRALRQSAAAGQIGLLPGVARQRDLTARGSEPAVPGDPAAQREEPAEAVGELHAFVPPPSAGGDDAGRAAALLERLLDRAQQHGVRADLQEDVVGVLAEQAHAVGEADRSAQVVHPVGRVHLPSGDRRAVDRGHQRGGGGVRADRGELPQQVLAQGVHHRGVGGHVHLHQPVERAAPGQFRADAAQRLGVAGQDGRPGRVLDGDADLVAVGAHQPPGLLGGHLGGQHRPLPGDAPHQPAAPADHRGPAAEVQGAAHAGGGHFAHAVADADVRPDAHGPPGPGERHLHRPEQRLHPVDPVGELLLRSGEQLQRGPAGLLADGPVAGGHRPSEVRGAVEQRPSHADPLGALPREDEHGVPGRAEDGGAQPAVRDLPALGQVEQVGGELPGGGGRGPEPERVRVLPQRGGGADLGQGVVRTGAVRPEELGVGAGQFAQRGGRTGAEHQQFGPAADRRGDGGAFGGLSGCVLADHHVGVGPGEPEGADSEQGPRTGLHQRPVAGDDLQRQFAVGEQLGRLLQVERGGQ